MPKKLELTGKKFNRLTVLGEAYNEGGNWFWRCMCDCGMECVIRGYALKNNHTKSCGCLTAESIRAIATTHGYSKKERMYTIWENMKQRCKNKNRRGYKYYGDRGIKISKEWGDYMTFRNDMHDGYISHVKKFGEKQTTLDRVNNDLGYSKENCRRATMKEQTHNSRRYKL